MHHLNATDNGDERWPPIALISVGVWPPRNTSSKSSTVTQCSCSVRGRRATTSRVRERLARAPYTAVGLGRLPVRVRRRFRALLLRRETKKGRHSKGGVAITLWVDHCGSEGVIDRLEFVTNDKSLITEIRF